MTASLGLGTYRIPAGEMAAAARRAALSPSAWIDTAPNYCDGRAHHFLAPVLAGHPDTGIATKTGFLTASTAAEAHAAGVVDDPGVRHSLDPRYVRWQTDRSRSELGRLRLDAVFLHNPEHHQQPGNGAELADRLRAAFAVLEEEEEAHAGRLASCGVATWEGFADGVFTVPLLDRLAAEAAGVPGRERGPALVELTRAATGTRLRACWIRFGPAAAGFTGRGHRLGYGR
ncbi:aldo/keto reductase [Streptomyces sp. NBC_00988]|uniref:aldo/keto reductase n=1 Tax=Streptomyces sp. NBC_00988 TaxID=2903704 RepID=UPI00386A20DA|nr:aldo/keto reductase [Streptomyces sp. NBC_00988]